MWFHRVWAPTVLSVGFLALVACQAVQPAPAAAPPKPAESTAAPAAQPAAKAVSPAESPAAKADWEKQWNQWLAAAKQEGKLVLGAGTPHPAVREQIPAAFQAKFGIAIEYIGGSSTDMVSRIQSERLAGLYTFDVFLSGVPTFANNLHPEKVLDPLKAALILPDAVDPSKWKKGKPWFIDPEEQYVLRLFSNRDSIFAYNTEIVKPEELGSIHDLLNPKWKGRIVAQDPTTTGAGVGTAAHLYKLHGEEWIKKLYIQQEPFITREQRQILDAVARGTHPVSMYAGVEMQRILDEGFPVEIVYSLPDAPGNIEAGIGGMGIVNKAPHPNATKVFANWMASREGLDIYARALTSSPLRNDIDEASFLRPDRIARPGVNYFDNGDWGWNVGGKEQIRLRMKELLDR